MRSEFFDRAQHPHPAQHRAPGHPALALEPAGERPRRQPDAAEPLPPYAQSVFGALAAVAWRLAQHPSPVTVPAGQSAELRRALALTHERLAEDVRFEDIARDVGLVPRSLARRFEDESGMTWRAVLRRMRVLRAIEELAAGEDSVTTVAHAVGYTSLSAFNAAFRDLTGRTPTQYRATFRP